MNSGLHVYNHIFNVRTGMLEVPKKTLTFSCYFDIYIVKT